MTTHIGFVSTRLAGTDGVSLETLKWSNRLSTMDCECFCFASESNWAADRSMIVPEAHFTAPEIQSITNDLFGDNKRTRDTSNSVQGLKEYLKDHLYRFIKQFEIHILITENALAIPMNIPLGLALAEVIAETGIPTTWSPPRFWVGTKPICGECGCS